MKRKTKRYKYLYDLSKQHAVEAKSIEDFLARYYNEQTGFTRCYREIILENEFKENGFCIISPSDSTTGECVAYIK
jgi:hypothetical protein